MTDLKFTLTEEQVAACAKAIFDNDYGDLNRLKASGRWPPQRKDSLTSQLESSTTALASAQNMIVARDRRISELEAVLAMVKRNLKHITDGSDYETCIDRCPACACSMPSSALDAAIASAKREALEEATRRLEGPAHAAAVRMLRRMAREVPGE